MTRSPHEVLGVRPDASLAEIKAARRRLAKSLHPDRNGEDGLAMREVNAAYSELLTRSPVQAVPVEDPPEPNEASFAVDVLPVYAYRLVAGAAAQLGDVWTVDEPYEIEVLLYEPSGSGLTIELVPDGGGTTVTLIPDRGRADVEPPAIELVERLTGEMRALIAKRGTRRT